MNAGQASSMPTYQKLVATIYQQFDYDFVGVALQEPAPPHLVKWRYVMGNQNERFRRIVLRRGIGIAGLVLRTGTPFWHNDVLSLDYHDQLYSPIARAENLRSVAAVPLLTPGSPLINGVLLAGMRTPKRQITKQDCQKLAQSLF